MAVSDHCQRNPVEITIGRRQHYYGIHMKQNPIPRVMALLLVSIVGAWLLLRIDASVLSKLDSMSAADYVQRQRELHHHSFVFHFIVILLMGGFYLGVIEFLSFIVGLCFPRKPAA